MNFMDDSHQQCDVSATEIESDELASDSGSSVNDLPQPPLMGQVKITPEEEEVKKYAQMICGVIYNHQENPVNTVDGDIIRAGKELHGMIESDLKDKMQTFIEK